MYYTIIKQDQMHSNSVSLEGAQSQPYPCYYFQFKPLEQLMGVFPASSKQHVPPTWQELMYQPVSMIRAASLP